MEGLFDYTSPTFLLSCAAGAALLGIGSYILQKQSGNSDNKKVLRDSILGVIFTLMAWVSVPDTMKQLSTSIFSEGTAEVVQEVAKKTVQFQDLELHVGPPGF